MSLMVISIDGQCRLYIATCSMMLHLQGPCSNTRCTCCLALRSCYLAFLAIPHMAHGCRLRISLGLKPLSMENSADTKRKEFEARQTVQAEQERKAEAAALRERVQK